MSTESIIKSDPTRRAFYTETEKGYAYDGSPLTGEKLRIQYPLWFQVLVIWLQRDTNVADRCVPKFFNRAFLLQPPRASHSRVPQLYYRTLVYNFGAIILI